MAKTWDQLYDNDLTEDICPGIVLHLDPARLIAEGATYSCDDSARVQGQHFFACITAEATTCTIIPLYSADGPGREPLDKSSRTGHPKWAGADTYFHPEQIWTATRDAIANAAARAHDKSRRGSRNTVASGQLPAPEKGG